MNLDKYPVISDDNHITYEFLSEGPNVTIFAKGSTDARTRLYQMGIFNNWPEICRLFDVEGFVEGKWEVFVKNKNYDAFALTAK